MLHPSSAALAALLLVPGAPSAPSDELPIEVFAALDAETLEVGQRYDLIVELVLPENADPSQAGAPAPILQLDVPPSVKLVGKHLETFKELAGNEFLAEPYERLMRDNPITVPIEIIAEPGADERLGVNVVGYARVGQSQHFLRRRLEVPIRPLAEGEPVDATNSRWGTSTKLMQIGDKASAFQLPRADGTKVDLADYLGKKNVIITTYRAFW